MFEKINISKVFVDHFKTLKVYDTKKTSIPDIFLFYIFPAFIGYLASKFVRFEFLMQNNTDLITFYSVFGGLMLNLLVLIYGYDIDKFKTKDLAKEVLKETSANISYLIAVSIILVLILFFTKTVIAIDVSSFYDVPNFALFSAYFKSSLVGFMFFSFINFFITMFMIVKRFYSLDSNRG